MPRPLLVALSALVLLALAACAGDRGSPSEPSGPLDPAGKSVCTGDVADLLDEVYSGGLETSRLARCANVQRQYARGQVLAATEMVHELIDDLLADAAAGQTEQPSQGTLEEVLAALIAALLAEVGIQADTNGIVVAFVDETGGEVVTPNMLGALEFDQDDLSGESIVAIVQLPGPSTPTDCPFAFDPPNDCYPHFFDFSVTPAGNLQDDVTGGVCVVDTGPDAPPNATVANRLQLASEDHLNPGTLIFWPVVTPPPGLQCAPAVASGWQRELFAALGPLAHLFRVTPAYANPGSLGGSMSSFSPFAAADPVVNTPTAQPVLLAPAAGATIAQNDPATADHDCTFSNGTWGFLIPFDWTDAVGAASYDIEMEFTGASGPAIQQNVTSSEYLHVECTGFIIDANLVGWNWRVRAVDAGNVAGPWTADRPIQFSSVNVSTTGTLSGQVTDSSGNPIAGATVSIPSTNQATTTDANGNYLLAAIAIPCCTPNANGGTVTHTVQASAFGFNTQQTSVTFTTGVPDAGASFQLVAAVIE